MYCGLDLIGHALITPASLGKQRLCHPHRAPVTLRGTGFKPDTARKNRARIIGTGSRKSLPRFYSPSARL